jgi:hypothetical protein|tara:strand:- start:993 stop:1280 length:288 start_codon:yes stop_codon:yes gene_type:complete
MAGRMTGSDVVTSSVTATGDMTTKRSRLRGFVVSGGSSDGTVTFKNTSSGSTLLVLPVSANATETLNIPDNGILFVDGIHATLSNIDRVTIFFTG